MFEERNDNVLTVREIHTSDYAIPRAYGDHLSFKEVGAARMESVSERRVEIEAKDVLGKAVLVKGILVGIPTGVLWNNN